MRIGKVLVLLVIFGAAAHHYDLINRFSGLGNLKDKAQSLTRSKPPSDPLFEGSTTLTDARGRAMQCLVLAKRGGTIAIRRSSDQGEFLIPTRNLSREDQQRISGVPDYRTDLIRSLEKSGPAITANRQARWHASLDQALGEAKTTGLPIYLLFTGTDW